MTRRVVVAVAASACALAAPAVAQAVPLKVTPRAPGLDDPLTVAFRAASALPAGQRYSVSVTVDGSGDCTAVAAQTSTTKARQVRVTVSSRDGNFTGTDRWCAGTATVIVRRGKATGGPAQLVGRTTVRLRG